jgi:hypothetical protein
MLMIFELRKVIFYVSISFLLFFFSFSTYFGTILMYLLQVAALSVQWPSLAIVWQPPRNESTTIT